MTTHVDERKAEKKLEPVDDLVELEEIVEEVEGDEEGETSIKDCQERIKKEEKEEETKEKEEKVKKLKNENQKEKVVEIEKKKGKSEANSKKKKKTTPIECKEVPYPLVPSRNDKERHLAKFLDIFKKLEITLPFGEALQQMPLYAKILKDMLTKKNRYIHSDCRNLPFCGRARRGSRVRLP